MNHGTLDACIDATYIIHVKGNGRMSQVLEQIRQFPPSKTIYIHRRQRLQRRQQRQQRQRLQSSPSPSIDLIHAYCTIFKHASKRYDGNILVLEDDFFFNKSIREKGVQEEIAAFVNQKKDACFMYYLGCIPFIQIPQRRVILSCGTHACIYSRVLRERTLKNKETILSIGDWDIYHNLYSTRYLYKEPVCYQLFPHTENSKQWGQYFCGIGSLLSFLFRLVGLDKRVNPGYRLFYLYSRVVVPFTFFLSILFFLHLFSFQ